MSRLIAYMGSDPERLRAALLEHRELLRSTTSAEQAGEVPGSWGLGFYQGGEVLLQRRPRVPAGTIDLYEAVKDLRTDAFLAQVVLGTESRLAKNENTPPYRFRSWIMVHQGTVPGLVEGREAVLALIPDFLKRNIRGQTPSEQLFHLFLASLHEAGRGQLEDANLPPELALRAFRHAWDRLCEALEQAPAGDGLDLSVGLSNGRSLLMLRRGPQPLWLRRLGPTLGDQDRGHDSFRGVLLATGPGVLPPEGAGFEEVPTDHAALVGRDLSPRVVSL